MLIEEYQVCLSLQRALLDRVTFNLRQVSFIFDENLITLYFIYDGKPSEVEEDLAGDVSAEVIADYPENYKINCILIDVKYPAKITSNGRVIFNRYEE